MAETYAAFTRAVIVATGKLDIILEQLEGPQKRITRDPMLPSWVPDYSQTRCHELDQKKASRDLRLVLRPLTDPRMLSLKGFQVGQVRFALNSLNSKHESYITGLTTFDIWLLLNIAYKEHFQTKQIHSQYLEDHGGDTHLSVQALADVLFDRSSPHNLALISCNWVVEGDEVHLLDLVGMRQRILIRNAIRELTKAEAHVMTKEQGLFWFQRPIWAGGTLFFTNRGVLGIAPPRTREGDLIVTFCGSTYPVILRPVWAKDTPKGRFVQLLTLGMRYELIGRCEVLGEMDGETLNRHDWNDVLHAEPTEALPVKDGYSHCVRGQNQMRFWDLV